MIDALDDVNFTLVPSHAGTRLHGSPVMIFGEHVYHYDFGGQKDVWPCFAMCAAAQDCGGFTADRSQHVCTFSRRNARLLKSDGFTSSNVYVK